MPMRPSFWMLPKLVTPLMMLNSTKGTAMSLSRLMKMSPNGWM